MRKKEVPIKPWSILFLKGVILLTVIVVLAGMIRLPQTEGRAAHLDLIRIYSDPFVIYLYIASIPFFVALFQANKLVAFVEKNKIFSKNAVTSLRNIKYCAIAFAGFVAAAVFYIFLMAKVNANKSDDPAGFIALGLALIFASIVIATAVAVFQKLLQNAIDIKSKNDLTV